MQSLELNTSLKYAQQHVACGGRFVLCFVTAVMPQLSHDDVTKWKHFPRYWPFVRGIHRFPVNSPHKGQ